MTLEELNLINFEEPKRQDAVIISFGKFSGLDEIHEVDKKLFENIPENIGSYDGHEVNMDDTDGRLFAYGNNAEILYSVMEPILKKFEFLREAEVYLEFTKDNKVISDIEFKMN